MTGKCWNISTNQQTQKPRFVGGVLLAQPLQFCSVPPLFGGLQGGNLSYQEEKDFFMVKIQDILQKQAASLVPLHSREKGFYSKLVSAGLFSGVSDMYGGNVFHALSAHKVLPLGHVGSFLASVLAAHRTGEGSGWVCRCQFSLYLIPLF